MRAQLNTAAKSHILVAGQSKIDSLARLQIRVRVTGASLRAYTTSDLSALWRAPNKTGLNLRTRYFSGTTNYQFEWVDNNNASCIITVAAASILTDRDYEFRCQYGTGASAKTITMVDCTDGTVLGTFAVASSLGNLSTAVDSGMQQFGEANGSGFGTAKWNYDGIAIYQAGVAMPAYNVPPSPSDTGIVAYYPFGTRSGGATGFGDVTGGNIGTAVGTVTILDANTTGTWDVTGDVTLGAASASRTVAQGATTFTAITTSVGTTGTVGTPSAIPQGAQASALAASVSGGTLTINAGPGLAALAPGSYPIVVKVGDGVSSEDFTVNLTVQQPPTIGVTNTDPAIVVAAGAGNPAPVVRAITNTGSGSVTSLAAAVVHQPGELGDWLGVALDGTVAPANLTLTPNIAPGGAVLFPGLYHATVTITSPDAASVQIPVTLRITPTTAATLLQFVGLAADETVLGGRNITYTSDRPDLIRFNGQISTVSADPVIVTAFAPLGTATADPVLTGTAEGKTANVSTRVYQNGTVTFT